MKAAILALFVLAGLVEIDAAAIQNQAATTPAPAKKAVAPKTAAATKAPAPQPAAQSKAAPSAKTAAKSVPAKTAVAKKLVYKPAPPVDPTAGDVIDGEDLTVRRAAVAALGTMIGAVVAVDPSNGRVLSIVNQKVALRSGFTPCSTIKLVTALAALSEGIIQRDTPVHLTRATSYTLTTAIAHSNNQYFQKLGNQLGYERVTRYARMLGLGEKAGLDIRGEESGAWPDAAPAAGGVGMMTAYGENILMTPLELAALLSAIADNGTLYYLQYPANDDEAERIEPRVKRQLELSPNGISDVKTGMRAAVDIGTAHSASYNPDEPILGKTGTCTDFRDSNHMGWFGSFNEVDNHRLVLVVLLRGTRTVNGPAASGVAGAIYKKLSEQRYFASASRPQITVPEILSTSICCSR